MRLLDLEQQQDSNRSNRAAPNGSSNAGARIFVVRRISAHLRQDADLWTFIYICSPYMNFDDAHLTTEIPGNVQMPISSWIADFINEKSPCEFLEDLRQDGFGFVLKVLREIKTTWKLLLNEIGVFLEDLIELHCLSCTFGQLIVSY